MLGLPETGIARSIEKHNSKLTFLCDWIEASVVFSEERISRSDVADILIEHEVYASQDFAAQMVEMAWNLVAFRVASVGEQLGVVVNGNSIERTRDWAEFPAYAFCLAVSCAQFYKVLRGAEVADYAGQGQLFEEVAQLALRGALPGWEVKRVGWSPENAVRLTGVIDGLISDLREVAGSERDLHVTPYANELGLDLLAFYPFADRNAAMPVMLFQCASGEDWTRKRHTPNLDIWRKVVSFISSPVKGLAIPYAFADDLEFRREATPVAGVFVERYRLLAGVSRAHATDVAANLNMRLDAWVSARVPHMPLANA